MILFDPSDSFPAPLLVVGIGMLGSAICREIRKQTKDSECVAWELEWSNQNRLHKSWDEALERLSRSRVAHIVWCAGKSGFGATPQEMEREGMILGSFLQKLSTIESKNNFHYFSSGGGLYEGAKRVAPTTKPAALRAYGEGKLKQEGMVTECQYLEKIHFYRPSSVYGYYDEYYRNGLIGIMVRNTLLYQTTFYSGHLGTLRDFVWAGDIAQYVMKQFSNSSESRVEKHLLASGKPTSIYEIRSKVEQIVGKKSYFALLRTQSNDKDISFLKSSIAPEFNPSSLHTNIRKIYSALLRGASSPRDALKHFAS